MSASVSELMRQGNDAFSIGQMARAGELLGQAASLLKPDDPARLQLLPRLGSALARNGQLVRADAVLTEAITRALIRNDQGLAEHADVERALWRLWSDPASEDDARSTAQNALQVFAEQQDEVGLAKAWRLLHDAASSWDEGQEALERAVDHARRAGDRREEADCLWWVGVYFVFGPMHAEEAIARSEEFLSDAKYDGTVRAGFLGVLGVLCAMRGRFGEARENFARGVAILEELGIKLRVVTRQHFKADIELLANDPHAAERAMRWAYDRELDLGEKQDIPGTTNRLADALYRQGRYDEAEKWIQIGGGRGIRAVLAARRGEFENADKLAREAVAMMDHGQNLNGRGTAHIRLAEVLSMAGRSAEAIPAVNEAIQLYERKGNLASAQEARALLEKLTLVT